MAVLADKEALIGRIVDIELAMFSRVKALESFWLRDLHERFPLAVRYDGRFEVYALGELETYSDQTLELYFRDVELAVEAGRNLVEERYEYLYKSLGFASLEEVEQRAQTAAH